MEKKLTEEERYKLSKKSSEILMLFDKKISDLQNLLGIYEFIKDDNIEKFITLVENTSTLKCYVDLGIFELAKEYKDTSEIETAIERLQTEMKKWCEIRELFEN